MAELRRDPLSGGWVVVGYVRVKETDHNVCPFCPGNEGGTGTSIREITDTQGAWLVRCFPALNPIFMIEVAEGKRADGMYDKMGNVGAHELVVESREHTKTFSEFTKDELASVLRMWAERMVDLKKDKRFKQVQVFRNHGELAGSYVYHPHSHILATAIIPHGIQLELNNSRSHYEQKQRCLFCDIITQELRHGKRVVASTENFLAYCPFAPRSPFEVWVVPRSHSATFETDLGSSLTEEFTGLFIDVMKRIERVRNAYSIVLHTAPNQAVDQFRQEEVQASDYFHWHIEILPRDFRTSRYKREDEFYTVSMTPEESANILRSEKF
jgi:UDPglucose--hexose-1-phosphate uridylyltransferase